MAFITPPENIVGSPINLKNVDVLKYTPYSKVEKLNHEKYDTAIKQHHFISTHHRTRSKSQHRYPEEKDFFELTVVEASIRFICPSGTYKWTLHQDIENTLKDVYNKLLTNTYVTKSL